MGTKNFDHWRLRLGVKWGRESRQVPPRFGRASHADVNVRWVEREKVGVEGPSSTAAGRYSFLATMPPPPRLAARERRRELWGRACVPDDSDGGLHAVNVMGALVGRYGAYLLLRYLILLHGGISSKGFFHASA